MESWRSTMLAIIPGLAGLALVIIGAVNGETSVLMSGMGLLGASGIGVVARDQRAHDQAQPPNLWHRTQLQPGPHVTRRDIHRQDDPQTGGP